MRSQSFLAFGLVLFACGTSNEAPGTPSNATTSSSSSSSGGASSSSSGDVLPSDGGARFVDSCNLAAAKCTAAPAGFAEGSGLAEVDRCAFALTESPFESDIIAALKTIAKPATVADVLNDANRVGATTVNVPGSPSSVKYAFRWQSDDNSSEQWIPQAISGSADATDDGKIGDKRAVLVSAYDTTVDSGSDRNNGVRIAFVDTTTPAAPRYRFVLLAEPKGTAAAPTFDRVKIHAGGMVWYRDYLYVADTSKGLRVFDMRHLLRVDDADAAFGCTATTCRAGKYRYVLPQVGRYELATADCKAIFSWVALDRTTNPPALVSGEYCSGDACTAPLAGRTFRWPLDAATGLLRSKVTFPTEAHLMSHKQVQGGISVNGTFYFSSSAPAGGSGDLYRVVKGKSATSKWGDTPEDLMFDPANGWLWSLNEKPGERTVFAVSLENYPKPL